VSICLLWKAKVSLMPREQFKSGFDDEAKQYNERHLPLCKTTAGVFDIDP